MTELSYRPIKKLLIANRGEIAVRIMQTCESLGIATVAVFSDADADAPFVRRADEAVRLGPAPSAESYLAVDKILEAAKRTGADAIHPGFGFLGENAAFAEAVREAGMIFVGPSPDAIRAMGSKREAKRIAQEAGVPVIPGYDGEAQDTATLAAEARAVGLPVLIKASAGGGGKGMRVVRDEAQLEAAVDGARREGESSFGDGTLLIEKYIERPRHVELQIFGDEHGHLVHLWERECSIQRRHQKIIEECPSPAVDRELREQMGAAAVKLGQAIGYSNAGTVEMILAPDGQFYFLEVNTRLQVEHPVTEAVSDLDLVELQIRVARGEPLPLDQEMVDTLMSGWAIECRIYAEDPRQGFLPQSGTVLEWAPPSAEWLRIDTGVERGSEVSIHYDPMIAKVIAWGVDRGQAIDRLRWALTRLAVQGLRTNRELLIQLLDHPAFWEGELSTHFIDEHMSEVLAAPPSVDALRDAAWAVTLHGHVERAAARRVLPSLRTGFRNSRYAEEAVRYTHGEQEVSVTYVDLGGGRFRVGFALDGSEPHTDEVRLVSVEGACVTLQDSVGHRRTVRVVSDGLRHFAMVGAQDVMLAEEPRFPDRSAESAADGAFVPMPGKIVKVLVSEGQEVTTGQTLVIMEAMKMEHSIGAPHDGVVAEVRVAEGQQVSEGHVVVVVREPGDEGA